MIYLTTYASEDMGLTEKRQREHMLGRKLLQVGLQREYALFLPGLSMETGANGKPFLPEYPHIHFNISHCSGIVVCGIYHRRIGVDVERIRPYSEKLCRKVLSPEEWEAVQAAGTPELFFRYWTLKESYVKATGIGLSVPLQSVTFSREDSGGKVTGWGRGGEVTGWDSGGKMTGWDSGGKFTCSCPGFEFYQTCLYGTYIFSICVGKGPAGHEERKGGYGIYDLSGSI